MTQEERLDNLIFDLETEIYVDEDGDVSFLDANVAKRYIQAYADACVQEAQPPYPVRQYDLSENITLTRMEQSVGPDTWAIRKGQYVCLSKSKKVFIYEPMPSNRDDAFLKDCRFDTIDAAIATWKSACDAAQEDTNAPNP